MNQDEFLNKIREIGIYDCKSDDENIIAIKIYQNDIDYLSKHYDEVNNNRYFFAIACAFSENIDVIKFIFERSIEYLTCAFKLGRYGSHYLGSGETKYSYIELACLFNQNIQIIKYLIEECGLVSTRPYLINNCLRCASLYNPKLEVIKYFIEDKNIDPLIIDNYHRDNCITLACWKNPSIKIPIYYCKNYASNINYREKVGRNCFDLILERNVFSINDVITFLSSINIKYIDKEFLKNLSITKYGQILDAMLFNPEKNYKLILKIIKSVPHGLNHDLTNALIKMSENYIIFDKEICDKMQIIHPVFNEFVNYNNFVNQIDDCEYYIALPGIASNISNQISLNGDLNNCNRNPYHRSDVSDPIPNLSNPISDPDPDSDSDMDRSIIDYTKNHKPLFKCNKRCYYGNQKKAYRSMLLFNDMADTVDFSELFELNIDAPKYVINLYVHSLHGYSIDINIIKPKDIESFVRLIDQYSTINLSIPKMELMFVTYFINNNIIPSDQIKCMCDRYKLKYMYMWIHNCKYTDEDKTQ
jgi:hypothetical protein